VKIIYKGNLIEFNEEIMSPDGWLQGSGIFETIKTVEGSAWALSRHMRRALNSATKLGITLPAEDEIRSSIDKLLIAENHARGALRISFDDLGNWAAFHSGYIEKVEPARLTIVKLPELSGGTPLKTFPYSHRLEILHAVARNGFDEAIVVNAEDKVCEGAVTNLLFRINNQWCTPPLSDGVLPGVMRALVVEYLEVQVRSIKQEEISEVQSAFLLSSLRIAQPVGSISGRELTPSHEFTAEIQAMALRTSVG
jgi:branched-chain amino acid aminotransferase